MPAERALTGETSTFTCRSCGSPGPHGVALSLGALPLGNTLVGPASEEPPVLPLELAACARCALVQVAASVPPVHLQDQYRYFTSASTSLVEHVHGVAADLLADGWAGPGRFVVEIGSNDGSLLGPVAAGGAEVLGFEPAEEAAAMARAQGIPTWTELFTPAVAERLRREGPGADVVVAISVFEVVPTPLELARGVAALLAPGGQAVLEVPYIQSMVAGARFDAISHLSASWFSLSTLTGLLGRAGLSVADAVVLEGRGGVLRVRASAAPVPPSERMLEIEADERRRPVAAGLADLHERIPRIRAGLASIVDDGRRRGQRFAAYGAGIKASTLLNVCGLDHRLLEFAVDRSAHRHGGTIPGVGLQVRPPEDLLTEGIDVAIITGLDFADEIIEQNDRFRAAGGRFVVAVPEPRVV